jgi:DNA-nicking Smr family endonuclease
MTVEEASQKVKFFLQNSSFNNVDAVIIITGKGLHSDEGPVLRKAVGRLLSSLHELVVEWGIAPREYGGDGALIVFLRKSVEK